MLVWSRATKLRWRRRIRRSKQQVEDIGVQAEDTLEKHFIKRLNRLTQVRRFMVVWLLFLVLAIAGLVVQLRALTSTYQKLEPVPGGVYTEGILGNFTNANPLFAVNAVDSSVSRLLFSGLLTYNGKNQLVLDLAKSYEVDASGTHYTFKLKPNLTWQDGQPLTAADVVFTYNVIKNPDAGSPLASSWQSITVEAPDDQTIIFTLPNALAAFPNSLTNGIVPKHLLSGIAMSQLRSLSFNTTKPVGAGPFKLAQVEVTGQAPAEREQQLGLVPFAGYQGGSPKLGQFIIRTFRDEKRMVDSFKRQELNGMAGLEQIPEELSKNINIHEYSLPLTSAVMVFFKNTAEPLTDVKVRQALVLAASPGEVIKNIGYPLISVREPILKGQIGYAADLAQASSNIAQANQILDADGWKMNKDLLREKAGKTLNFRLYSQNTIEYTNASQTLQKQWRAIGVDAQVFLKQDSDLQPIITSHGYDALLYGISIGADPDVFAYWHSSQTDLRLKSRFNLSEYKSTPADQSLEAGRTRLDAAIRTIKYRPFLDAWRTDNPALGLYQPRFLYITNTKVFNLTEHTINTPTDRLDNVANWMIREDKVNK